MDEADEMLQHGFKKQIYSVYRYLPPEVQVSFDMIFYESNHFSNILEIFYETKCIC